MFDKISSRLKLILKFLIKIDKIYMVLQNKGTSLRFTVIL